MGTFRKAQMVELHDAGVVLHVRGYADGAVGWREFANLGGHGLSVRGADIERLAQHFDFVSQLYQETRRDAQGQDRTHCYRLRDSDFEIKTTRIVVGGSDRIDYDEGGQTIIELEARVDNPQVLEIKVTFDFGNGDTHRQLITYCGNFTVWWDCNDLQGNEGDGLRGAGSECIDTSLLHDGGDRHGIQE